MSLPSRGLAWLATNGDTMVLLYNSNAHEPKRLVCVDVRGSRFLRQWWRARQFVVPRFPRVFQGSGHGAVNLYCYCIPRFHCRKPCLFWQRLLSLDAMYLTICHCIQSCLPYWSFCFRIAELLTDDRCSLITRRGHLVGLDEC